MFPIFIKVAIIATVIAAATIGIIVGIIVVVVPSVDNGCLNLQAPSDLEVVTKENHVIIRWSPSPTSGCDIHYDISVMMDGDDKPIEYNTTGTFITISRTPQYCTVMEVNITVVRGEFTSDRASLSYHVLPTPEAINSLEIIVTYDSSEKKLSWTNVADMFKRCTVEYKLIINKNEIDALLNTNDYLIPVDQPIDICAAIEVIVMPVLEGVSGTVQPDGQVIEFPPTPTDIDDIKITVSYDSTKRQLSWTNIADTFPDCTVEYKLIINKNEVDQLLSTNVYPIPVGELINMCADNEVIVMPIVEGVSGTVQPDGQMIEFPPSPTDIDAIQITASYDSSTRQLSWTNIGEVFPDCTVEYKLIINKNEVDQHLSTNGYTIPVGESINVCAENEVIVMPILGGVFGTVQPDGQMIEFPPSPTDIDAIQITASYDSSTRQLSWTNIAEVFSDCTVEYKLIINKNEVDQHLSNNAYTIPAGESINVCAENEVIVMPILGGVFGTVQPDGQMIGFPPSPTDIDAIQITASYDSSTRQLSWTNIAEVFPDCTVEYKLIINKIEVNQLLSTNAYPIPVGEYNICTDNEVIVMPILEEISGTVQPDGQMIEFPPSPTDIDAIQITASYDSSTRQLSWTNIAEVFPDCTVEYKLIINNNEVDQLLSTNAYTIPVGESINVCAENEVIVMPILGGVFGTVQPDGQMIEFPPTPTDIDAIQITASYDSSARQLSWTNIAEVFPDCTVEYKLLINKNEVEQHLSTNAYTIPVGESINVCAENEVIVMPILEGVSGTGQPEGQQIEFPPTPTDIDDIQITVSYDSSKRQLQWTNVADTFPDCTVEYKLIIDKNEVDQVLNTNAYPIPVDEPISICAAIEVIVMPVLEGVSGTIQPDGQVIEFPPTPTDIDDIQITVSYDSTTKQLSWTNIAEVFPDCTVGYKLIINKNEVEQHLSTNAYTIPVGESINVCAENEVIVMPILEGVSGTGQPEGQQIEFPPTPTDIDDIQITVSYDSSKRQLSWTNVADTFPDCTVEYKLIIDKNEVDQVLNTNAYPIPVDEPISICAAIEVIVMPVLEGVSGTIQPDGQVIEFPPTPTDIDDIQITVSYDSTTKQLSWTNIAEVFPDCTVEYKLLINKNEVDQLLSTNAYTIPVGESINVCADNEVIVMPILEGVSGTGQPEGQQIEFPPTPTDIDDIQITVSYDSAKRQLSWTNVADTFPDCTVEYKLIIDKNEVDKVLNTNAYPIPVDEPISICAAIEVIVMPVLEGVSGTIQPDGQVIEFPPTPTDIDDIQITVSYDSTTKQLSWTNIAEVFPDCTVEYKLTINKNEVDQHLITNAYTIPLGESINVCAENEVIVMPILEGVSGTDQPEGQQIEFPPTPTDIDDIQITVSYDSSKRQLSWTDIAEVFPDCIVEYKLIINKNEVDQVLSTNAYPIPVDEPISMCAAIEVIVMPVLEGVSGTIQPDGQVIEFPPTPTDIDDIQITVSYDSTTKQLSWTNIAEVFPDCTVGYKLIINKNEVEQHLSTNAYTIPVGESINVCAENEVIVMPILEGVSGTGQPEGQQIEFPPTPTDIDDIQITLSYDSSKRQLSWTNVADTFPDCTVEYKLIIDKNEVDQVLNTNAYPIPVDEPISICAAIEVIVMPVLEGVSGTIQPDGQVIEFPPTPTDIDDIQITVSYDSTTKQLSWTNIAEVFPDCTVEYKLLINKNEVDQLLSTNAYTIPVGESINVCADNEVIVMPILEGVSGTGQSEGQQIEFPPTPTDIDDIQITVSYDSSKRQLSWTNVADTFPDCTVEYKLIIDKNEVDQVLNINAYPIPVDEPISICAAIEVIVMPVLEGVSGTIQPDGQVIEFLPARTDIDAIQITASYDSSKRQLSWTNIAEVFPDCTVEYKLLINKNEVDQLLSTNAYTIPVGESINVCADNEVIVMPILEGVSGTGQSEGQQIEFPPTPTDIDDIQITVSYDSSKRQLSWTNVADTFPDCTVEYKLIIDKNEVDQVLNINAYPIPVDEPISICAAIEVIVMPVLEGVSGTIQPDGQVIEFLPAPTDIDAIQITASYDSSKRQLSWTNIAEVFPDCTVEYKLLINKNEVDQLLSTNAYTIPVGESINVCADNEVIVMPILEGVSGTGQSEGQQIEFPPTPTDIDDIQITVSYDSSKRQLSWTNVADTFPDCTVEYKLIIDKNEVDQVLNINAYPIPVDEPISICAAIEVIVMPVLEGVSGTIQPDGQVIEFLPAPTDIDAIQITASYDSSKRQLSWTNIAEVFPDCTVEYKLLINKNEVDQLLSTNAYTIPVGESINVCADNEVIVMPILEGVSGTGQSEGQQIEFPPTPTDIDDIQITVSYDSSKRQLSWTNVADTFPDCTVEYKLIIDKNEVDQVLNINAYPIPVDEPISICAAIEVIVMPVLEGVSGTIQPDGQVIEFLPAPTDIDAIQITASYDSSKRQLSWTNIAEVFPDCTVEYKLLINKNEVDQLLSTNAYTIPVGESINVCADNEVIVMPILEGVSGTGQPEVQQIEFPPTPTDIDDIQITVSYDSAKRQLSWTNVADTFPDCTVEYKLIIDKNEVDQVLNTNAYPIPVDEPISICAAIEVIVMPVLEGVSGTIQPDGQVIEFPPTPTDIDDIQITVSYDSTTKQLSWTNIAEVFPDCTVEYKLLINKNEIDQLLSTNAYTIPVGESINVCADNEVIVMPILEGVSGTGQPEGQQIEFPPTPTDIDDIQITVSYDSSKRQLSWTNVADTFPDCTVEYKLIIDKNEVDQVLNTNAYPIPVDEPISICATIEVIVMPILEEVSGTVQPDGQMIEFPPTPTDIDAIQITASYDSSTRELSWTDIAEVFPDCTVEYKLIINNNEVDQLLSTNAYTIPVGESINTCAENEVIVMPILEGVSGTGQSEGQQIQFPSANIPKVENSQLLLQAEKTVIVKWDPPKGFETEELIYNLKLTRANNIVLASDRIDNGNTWTPEGIDPIEECDDIKVSIIPEFETECGPSDVVDCTLNIQT